MDFTGSRPSTCVTRRSRLASLRPWSRISSISARFQVSALGPSCPDTSVARLNEANNEADNDMSNGAELLVDALVQRGIDTIFGFPGDTSIALYDVLARRTADVRHVLARDERHAGFMADAYSRTTR